MPIVAKEKGFCEKYNFKCEIKTLNSTSLGLQALVGKTIDVYAERRTCSARRSPPAARS